jgi:hypothetical protein
LFNLSIVKQWNKHEDTKFFVSLCLRIKVFDYRPPNFIIELVSFDMKYWIILFLSMSTIQMTVQAQYPFKDSSALLPKPEKGPNKGRMFSNNGLKIEMNTPSNTKKPEVSYFVYDSLSTPIEATQYTGTVKYVFGNINQYLEVKLVPKGKPNQSVTTLEAWNECKQIIVTIKTKDGRSGKVSFVNEPPPKADDINKLGPSPIGAPQQQR